MKRYLFLPILLFPVLATADYCQGIELSGLQPPAPYGVFSTMSTKSPPQGKAAVAFSVERSGDPEYWRVASNLAYGITDNVEFSASIPYVDDTDNGLEDIAFGIKHRFFDEGRYGPSVAYILAFSVASGVEGLTTDGSLGAGIALSKRVGPVNGHVNFFYLFPGDSDFEEEVRFSAGLDFSASHDFKILGEILGRKSHFTNEIDQLEMRFGYRFIAHEDMFTTIGVGFDVEDRAPEYRIMVSMTLLFPREEKAIERVYE